MLKVQDHQTGLAAIKANNAPAAQQNQGGFDILFAEADLRQSQSAPVAENRNQQRGENRSQSNQQTRNDTPRAERERTPRTDRSENRTQQDTAPVEEAAYATYAPDQPVQTEPEVDESQAIAAVAAILQLPVEAVAELLTEQGLTVADLADPKAVAKLLQSALGAETPAELLTEPTFPELYKAINEAMVELVQTPEVTASITAQSAQAEVQTTQAYQTYQAENLDNLQLITEDGEAVVVEKPTANSANQSSTNTSQSNTGSSANAEPQLQTQTTAQETALDPILATGEEVTTDQPQLVDPLLNMTTARARVEAAIRQSAPAQVDATDVIEQIMNQVKVTNLGGNFTEMRLTLRPESLGDIVLRVLTQNGIVTAQFEAENQRVKETLEASFNQLRDALEGQGIQFSELSVSVRQDGDEQLNQFEQARHRTRHRMNKIQGIEEAADETPININQNGTIDLTA